MASKIAENLEATWSLVATFTAETSTSSLADYTAFFEPDAVVYLMGSTAPPAIGREALTTTLQSILTYWGLIERKVLTSVVDEKRRTVANSMSNKLRIGDKILDDFGSARSSPSQREDWWRSTSSIQIRRPSRRFWVEGVERTLSVLHSIEQILGHDVLT